MNMGLLNKNNKVQTMSWIDYATGSNINLKNLIQLIKEDAGEMTYTQDLIYVSCAYGPNKIIKTWFSMGKKCGAYWEYTYYVLREDGTFGMGHFSPEVDYKDVWFMLVTKEYAEKILGRIIDV